MSTAVFICKRNFMSLRIFMGFEVELELRISTSTPSIPIFETLLITPFPLPQLWTVPPP